MTIFSNDSPPQDKALFEYFKYNSYRSQKYKLFYVATPKVACTSLKWWLADLEGYTQLLRNTTKSGETSPDRIIHDTFHKLAPNVTGLDPHEIAEVLSSNSYFRFAVVRNPFKRIFSAWQSKVLFQEPLQVTPYRTCAFFNRPVICADDIATAFEEFLEHLVENEAPTLADVHWAPQLTLLRPDLVNYSKVARIEAPQELVIALMKHLGNNISDPFLNIRLNHGLIPYLPEFLTQRSAEIIQLLYAKDFEAFGYDQAPPALKNRCSPNELTFALKSIPLIRERNQRLGEMNASISNLSCSLHLQTEKNFTLNKRLTCNTKQLDEMSRALKEQGQTLAEHTRQVDNLSRELAIRATQIDKMSRALKEQGQTLAERTRQVDNLNLELATRATQIAKLSRALHEKNELISQKDSLINQFKQEQLATETLLNSVFSSLSWKITEPLRRISCVFLKKPAQFIEEIVRQLWHRLPFSVTNKERIKAFFFINFPTFLGPTAAYKLWKQVHTSIVSNPSLTKKWKKDVASAKYENDYVPLLKEGPPARNTVKLICFYLPQFHAIPENDEWWGEGFTEWTNVKAADPQFDGHYQPRVPGELGYYNLLDTSVQKRQVELAKLYGISAFCFYFYWFGGKRLLEKPIANYLQNQDLDLPFCLCWANENWSRRWDGLEQELLITQKHSPEDDISFIDHVSKYMRDSRYIRINGKPLLIVYRPSLLPSAKKTAARWRKWCAENGIGQIYLAYTQSFEKCDPKKYGFDSAIEFPPNNSAPPNITATIKPLTDNFNGIVYDWNVFPERSKRYTHPNYVLFRSVCPSWDNTARRKKSGTIFVNNTPKKYEQWLSRAINETRQTIENPDEHLIFINAWNEWAEGAYLEPDQRYGYAYLQATRNAISDIEFKKKPSILIVTHDCHPHGAQFLILNVALQIKNMGYTVCVLALGEGRLWEDFKKIGPALCTDPLNHCAINDFISKFSQGRLLYAITSTVVCGSVLHTLKNHNLVILSLIHEMPGVLRSGNHKKNAKAICQHSNTIVFPANLVKQGFIDFCQTSLKNTLICPQGILRQNPYKKNKQKARAIVLEKHNLPATCRIVLNVAFIDHRKGPDLFINIAEKTLRTDPNTFFIWIGHPDPETEKMVKSNLKKLRLEKHVLFIGFDPSPLAYYAAADVYALTSREDPFPNVVLESAEVNVPIVAFKGTTGAEDFIVKRGGRIAKYLDTDDFSKHLHLLLHQVPAPPVHPVKSLRKYTFELLHHLIGCPRISVIVPNYNYQKHIAARLNSIDTQTLPIYELIILDDASSDNSRAIIESFCETTRTDYKLLLNHENSGSVFRQWKKGLENAQGDLIWIAEADDLACPNFLESLVPSFEDSAVVMAYSQSQPIDKNDKPLAKNYLHYTDELSDIWKTDYIRDGKDEIRLAHAVKNPAINVSAVLFRKEALENAMEKVGTRLFDFQVAGDWLIYLHTLTQGKVSFCSQVLNFHRRHGNNVTNSTNKEKHYNEICQLQDEAARLAPPSKEIQHKAINYRDKLRRQFNLT